MPTTKTEACSALKEKLKDYEIQDQLTKHDRKFYCEYIIY